MVDLIVLLIGVSLGFFALLALTSDPHPACELCGQVFYHGPAAAWHEHTEAEWVAYDAEVRP